MAGMLAAFYWILDREFEVLNRIEEKINNGL
jgi:hypothetical protein